MESIGKELNKVLFLLIRPIKKYEAFAQDRQAGKNSSVS